MEQFNKELLIRTRKRLGLTQKQLAEACEITPKTYIQAEKGRHVKRGTLLVIIGILRHDYGVNLSFLDFNL